MTCTIISFYADRETNKNVDTDTSTYYSDHAKRLTEELKKIDIPHDIRELKSQNNYMKNCLMKPGFILSMLEEKKSPVLWMDIDCLVKDFPKDFADSEYDICFVKRDKRVPESCFIYFNYTKNSLNFIKEWKNICDNSSRNLDHLVLIELYSKYKDLIKIKEYPWYYANPQNLPEVRILMLSSKFSDKRQTEIKIQKEGSL